MDQNIPAAGNDVPSPDSLAALSRALVQVAKSDNPDIVAGLAKLTEPHSPTVGRLLKLNEIGAAVFGANAPSERTLRSLTKRGILPFFRVGRLIYYDVRLVRAALELQCLVQAKKARTA